MLDFQLYFIWISKNTQKYWNVYNIYLKYNGSQANKQNIVWKTYKELLGTFIKSKIQHLYAVGTKSASKDSPN